MPKITTSEIIGLAAAVISAANIFIAFSTVAVPTGVQRFLGINFAEQKLENVKFLVKVSSLLITIGIVASSITILIGQNWIENTFGIDFTLSIIAIFLIASSCFINLFRGVVISSQKTKMLPIIMIVAGSAKIALAIILISIGTGALGLTIGFTSFAIISSLLLALNIHMILKTTKEKPEIHFRNSVKNILNASVVSWIPGLVTTFGIHLGTIVVFGSQGANQAGVYFIAFSVSAAITSIMFVFFEYAYPYLSGRRDGRKATTWRLTKVSLLFGMPIVSFIIFYSKDILQLFGNSYVEGSFTLEILLWATLPLVVGQGVRTLVYAYGNYSQVLGIGLSISIPRIVLYFILVPIFGITGAALSFTIGTLGGFVIALIIAKKVGLKLFVKDLALIFTIPTVLGYALSYFEINVIVSVFVIILVPYILFIRLGILTKDDVHDSVIVLPKNVSQPVLNLIDKLAKKFKPSY